MDSVIQRMARAGWLDGNQIAAPVGFNIQFNAVGHARFLRIAQSLYPLAPTVFGLPSSLKATRILRVRAMLVFFFRMVSLGCALRPPVWFTPTEQSYIVGLAAVVGEETDRVAV